MIRREWIVVLGCAFSSLAPASTNVDISGAVNANLRSYHDGADYPLGGTSLVVSGVTFDLANFNNDDSQLGIIQTVGGQGDQAFNFALNIPVSGPMALYTLINSAYGSLGANIGTVTVTGFNGETASFDLVEGFNVRDHANTSFVNTLSDPTVVPTYFIAGVGYPDNNGHDRLDRQTLVLPASFNGDVITQLTFLGHDMGSQGLPFLAAASFDAVPEPATMFALGLGAIALLRRRKG